MSGRRPKFVAGPKPCCVCQVRAATKTYKKDYFCDDCAPPFAEEL